MGNNFYLQAITMSCGGWSTGELNDRIRELLQDAKVHTACTEHCKNVLGMDCVDPSCFEPKSVEQQVVSGMNYKVTGECCGNTITFLIWDQPWNGGVQVCEVQQN